MSDKIEEKAERYRMIAETIDKEAEIIKRLETTKGTPWSEHFHEARTCRSGSERAVATIYVEDGEVSKVKVDVLSSGEHFRNPTSDVTVGFSLPNFAPIELYKEHMSAALRDEARHLRNKATELEGGIER